MARGRWHEVEEVDMAMADNWSFNVHTEFDEGPCEMLDVKQLVRCV